MVIHFFSAAMYQSYLVVTEFLRYPKITQIQDFETSLDWDDSKQLPDLTVCNLNPLSHRAYNSQDILTFPEYVHNVTSTNLTEEEKMELKKKGIDDVDEFIKERMLALHSYHNQLGFLGTQMAGHYQDEFIVTCKKLVVKGNNILEKDCSNSVDINFMDHPKYFNCYTFAMRNHSLDALGFALTLHLANYNSD